MVPPSFGGLPPSQVLAQFLTDALSRSGSLELPYSDDVKWYVRQHLIALVDEYPSLQVKTAVFTHDAGATATLLRAEGTIPMFYNRVIYNIPVVVWLLEHYPRHPPRVYVNPTRDMIIRRAHPLVSPSGVVSLAYLRNWIFPTSNLVELVRQMGHLFGQDPPLYTKPQNTAVDAQRRSSSPSSLYASVSPPSSSNSRSWSISSSDRLLSPYKHMPLREDPCEIFKKDAVNKLVAVLNADAIALSKSLEGEKDALFNAQAALSKRGEKIDKGLQELQDERDKLERLLQFALMNIDVLGEWVQNNGEKKKSEREIDIDHFFEPLDGLSEQMLECMAMDLAIEDTIYSLDKAMQGEAIPFDAYIRNVRALSREQFFLRATSAKVRAAQMQVQVSCTASSVSGYGGV